MLKNGPVPSFTGAPGGGGEEWFKLPRIFFFALGGVGHAAPAGA